MTPTIQKLLIHGSQIIQYNMFVPMLGDLSVLVRLHAGGDRRRRQCQHLPQVGWSRYRVKVVGKRPPTCYRCQDRGHHAVECKNPAWYRRCYQCNGEGQFAANCGKDGKGKRPPPKEDAADRRSGGEPVAEDSTNPPPTSQKCKGNKRARLLSIT